MNRLDFSKDLNKFSFFYKNKNSAIFEINDESQKRIFISRLYYSLYHRLLTELSKEKNLTGPGGHKTVFIALEKQAGNGAFYRRLFTHFKDLRKLREWADNDFYIEEIIADAITSDGKNISQSFGLTKIKETDHSSTLYYAKMLPPNFKGSKDAQLVFNKYKNYYENFNL